MSPSFADLGVPSGIASDLAARGITTPFPIQAATIADGLAGRDICGRAPTGSGKTIAFGIPLVTGLERGRPRRPRALVLAPTRELAEQITEELRILARSEGGHVLAVYGGVGYGPQRSKLQRGVNIVVACPGRLEDLLEQGAIDLGDVDRVVVDEADRMADMGFLPAVTRILDRTARHRQTLLFSATLDSRVDALIAKYQSDPVRHSVEGMDDEGDVRHHLMSVTTEQRTATTAELIEAHGASIVFCRTRHGADRLSKRLRNLGVRSAAIHGGRSQRQRQEALTAFISGKVAALIATDVAARGIHVDSVACVVHYDPPPDPEDYTHRSGRTGRAGETGTVVTLATPGKQLKETRRALAKWGVELQPDGGAMAPVAVRVPSKRSEARKERRADEGAGPPATAHEPTSADRGPSDASRQATPPRRRRQHRRVEATDGPLHGTMKFFDRRRGFGFIEHPDLGDVFVHHTHLPQFRGDGVKGGERVTFELGQGPRGDEAQKVCLV